MADIPLWVRYPAALILVAGATACGTGIGEPTVASTAHLADNGSRPARSPEPTPEQIPEGIMRLMRNPRLEAWRLRKVEEGSQDIFLFDWPGVDPNRPDNGSFLVSSDIRERREPLINPDNIAGILGPVRVGIRYAFGAFTSERGWENWAVFNDRSTTDDQGQTIIDGRYMAMIYGGELIMHYLPRESDTLRSWAWTGPQQAHRGTITELP